MKKEYFLLILASFALTSCARNGDETWDNCKTAKRHFGRGVRALCGGGSDSRQIDYRDQFWANRNSVRDEFVALQDDMGRDMIYMENVPQARDIPGDAGSGIPGIEAFSDPAKSQKLSGIYKNIRFGYDSSLVKGDENLATVRQISSYMKKNPHVYIFAEGHCDTRGPEAYNLALGTRRANAVRNILVKEGVNPEHIFTVSYGKERPLVYGNDEESHALNRRTEFKVYERK